VLGFLLAARAPTKRWDCSFWQNNAPMNEARLKRGSNNWGSDLSAFATPAEIA